MYLVDEYLSAVDILFEEKCKSMDFLIKSHEKFINETDNHIFKESDSFNKLSLLYLKEAEEVKSKGTGIIKKLINMIKSVINTISKILFGKSEEDENNYPDTIKLKDNPETIEKENKKWTGAIKKFISGNKKALVALIGTTATIATATGVIIHKNKVKKALASCKIVTQDTKTAIDDLEKKIASAEANPNSNITAEELKNMKIALKELHKQMKSATTCVNDINKSSKNSKESKYSDSDNDDMQKIFEKQQFESDEIKRYINSINKHNGEAIKKDLLNLSAELPYTKKDDKTVLGKLKRLNGAVKEIDSHFNTNIIVSNSNIKHTIDMNTVFKPDTDISKYTKSYISIEKHRILAIASVDPISVSDMTYFTNLSKLELHISNNKK